MKLSKRLELVASFVGRGSRIADVGTDHGYIPIALVERNVAKEAIAMDIRPGPLGRAREHIRQHGLEERIGTRLGDGTEKLSANEAETVIIAGMGGEMVVHILEEGRHLWDSVEHWILSPQSEFDKVRDYLEKQGFSIAREGMAEEDGKYYTVMDVVRFEGGKGAGREAMTEAGRRYGPVLIRERNPVLKEFLEREEGQLDRILKGLDGQAGERAEARKEELAWRLGLIRETLEAMGAGQTEGGEV